MHDAHAVPSCDPQLALSNGVPFAHMHWLGVQLAEPAEPVRWYEKEQKAHSVAPLALQLADESGVPFSHSQLLAAQNRSPVAASSSRW